MADNITLSLLMQDSYNEGKENRGGADIEQLGFIKLDDGRDEQSGFQAQAYINTAIQEIVMANVLTISSHSV